MTPIGGCGFSEFTFKCFAFGTRYFLVEPEPTNVLELAESVLAELARVDR